MKTLQVMLPLHFSEYKKAAEKLKSSGLVLAKVDASKEGELAREHFIQGFPTLTVFKYGEKVVNVLLQQHYFRSR